MERPQTTIHAFGDFELDESRFELRRDGARVPLEPKPLRLLLYPVALLTAGTLILLATRGPTDPIGVAVNGFVAYVLAVWGRLSVSLCFAPRSEESALRVAPEIAAVDREARSNH